MVAWIIQLHPSLHREYQYTSKISDQIVLTCINEYYNWHIIKSSSLLKHIQSTTPPTCVSLSPSASTTNRMAKCLLVNKTQKTTNENVPTTAHPLPPWLQHQISCHNKYTISNMNKSHQNHNILLISWFRLSIKRNISIPCCEMSGLFSAHQGYEKFANLDWMLGWRAYGFGTQRQMGTKLKRKLEWTREGPWWFHSPGQAPSLIPRSQLGEQVAYKLVQSDQKWREGGKTGLKMRN